MKKAARLLMPLLGLLVAIGAVLLLDAWQPPAWRADLEAYVEHRASLLGAASVVYTRRARYPEQFSRAIGHATYGDSLDYQLDESYTGQGTSGAPPLPYPPEQVRCVLLEWSGAQPDSQRHQIVFVALHHDLHRAAWVVHEGEAAPYSAAFVEGLSSIGCAQVLDARRSRLFERQA